MSAYVVFNYTVTDPEGYAAYPRAAGPTMGAFGAEVLVADYSSETLEGGPGEVTVVLRFESREAARAWYDSADYQAAKPLRTGNTAGLAVICDGFVMPGG
jgi:uncharacterized protein (DUF1330 family)